jgi:hypothetical protein
MRTRAFVLSIACLGVAAGFAACTDSEPAPPATATDSATQRERQEAIGESRLPGAQGVRGALDASDQAAARAARLDSASRQP